MGQHKAVVVLGVRLAQMQQRGFNLGHQDVTILEIRIVSRCNGVVVQEALVGASQAVGVPQAVVSDGGSEVKSGVALFAADHPQVVWHYDLSHRLALLLEKELGGQEWWGAFMTQTARCRQRCRNYFDNVRLRGIFALLFQTAAGRSGTADKVLSNFLSRFIHI